MIMKMPLLMLTVLIAASIINAGLFCVLIKAYQRIFGGLTR